MNDDQPRLDTGHLDMSPHDQTLDMSLDTSLSIREAATRADVTEKTVRRWIKGGLFDGERVQRPGSPFRLAHEVGRQPLAGLGVAGPCTPRRSAPDTRHRPSRRPLSVLRRRAQR